MKITKRRVTKTNRIKRKYSKKRTKTRHSRKRVFSKKRRKTNKKKKRGGGILDKFKDKFKGKFQSKYTEYTEYRDEQKQKNIEKQEKKKKEEIEKKRRLFTEHNEILEDKSWLVDNDKRYILYSNYENNIIEKIKDEANRRQLPYIIAKMKISNSEINKLRGDIQENKYTDINQDFKKMGDEKIKLLNSLKEIFNNPFKKDDEQI